MDLTLLFPALMCGVFCYLGAIESACLFGMSGGYYVMGRPLVAGLLCGLVFGDVSAGVLCGVAVQAVFIANLSTGGATNSEITYASYGGIGLAMATTKDPAIAVTLSVLMGQTLGLIFYNTRMALYSFFNGKAQLIFFLAGFVLLAFAGLSMIAIVFLAALVAYLVFLSSGKSAEPALAAAEPQETAAVYEDDDLF